MATQQTETLPRSRAVKTDDVKAADASADDARAVDAKAVDARAVDANVADGSAVDAKADPAGAEPVLTEPAPTNAAPTDEAARADQERERIAQQLAELERKQAELKRALAMADHPELADALREVEGRAYGVRRVEEQLAQPLSKSEERQRAKLEKKLAAAQDKRAALDAQIEALQAELGPLAHERVEQLKDKRRSALHQLFSVLARHSDGFEAAGLQVTELVPELDAWLPELRTMAGQVADAE